MPTMHTEVHEAGEIAARTDRAFHRVLHRSLADEPLSERVDAVRAGDAEAAETAVHRPFDDIRSRLSRH
ncbi:hypothetical protein ACIQ8D_26995 [Streptomyces sp. NPDC096094]|uniref:hypothetical protein n=1 Tax=Streptomyces sp. NPDC096094 TaxID=3366073 RepID=UPI0037F8FAD1